MNEPRGYLVGIHEFIGRNVDELDIHKGEYVEVIEDDSEFGDSWYIGRNLNTGKSGLFPKVFTASVSSVPPEILERAARLPEFVLGNDDDAQFYSSQSPQTSGTSAVTATGAPIPPVHNGAGSYNGSKESFYASQSTDSDYLKSDNGSRSGLSIDTNPHGPAQATQGTQIPQTSSSNSLSGPVSASVTATMSDIDAAISEIAAQGPSLDAIGFWTPHDVQQYLLSRGYDAPTAQAFVKHRITGLILLELDLAHLKEIDITSFGTRFEISKEIKYLNRVVEQTGQALPVVSTPTLLQGSQIPALQQPQPQPHFPASGDDDQPSTPLSAPTNIMWNGAAPRQQQLRSPFSDSPQDAAGSTGNSQPVSGALQSPLHEGPGTLSASTGGFATPSNTGPRHKSMRSSEFEGLERCETPLSESSELAPHPEKHQRAFSKERAHSFGKDSATPMAYPQAGTGNAAVSPAAAAAAAAWSPSTNSTPTFATQYSDLPRRDSDDKPQSPNSTPPARPDRPKRNNTLKNFRSASSQYLRPAMVKQKTSAFTEGIQQTTAEESARTAQASGWMQKRGGMGVGTWSKRFFTLHGTRLSYFAGFKDDKERGLIDITGHRVMALKEGEDKLVSLYAAGVGAGRYCFKLVPPAPGYRKGVSFTAPKTHYFACESQEEMRMWIAALTKATIERDESVPVISSCTTPSVSLPRAQELIAERLAAELSEESGEDTMSIPSSQPTDTPPQTPAFSVPSSQSGSAGTGHTK